LRRVRVVDGDGPRWGRLEGAEIVLDSGARLDPEAATWLAPALPTKIVAASLGYRSRLAELGSVPPAEPAYFLEPPSSLNGHRGELRRPAGTAFLNYEGELAVVIGQRMQGVSQDRAMEHVAGFACANDVGIHDFHHADRGSLLRVKGFDGSLPLGPARVTPDEWTPAAGYTLRTYLNGQVVQQATSDDALWPVSYLLADICRLVTLEPGDVVITGTPANSRPLQAGDVVEVEIVGLRRLENTVVEWDVDLGGPGEQLQASAVAFRLALALQEEEARRRARALGVRSS
jgi:2-keto-4-pentenoate hydratase/2-oxohepta-3-ene-1,7-dioic acid hydratase in catechol pathway